MNQRIAQLRRQSLAAVPAISHERAVLITDFYQKYNDPGDPVPVQRARAFAHILDHKALWVGEGELIVGERGEKPAAVPTYPEIVVHSLKDLDILDRREKISYRVTDETREVYRTRIIPFWEKRCIRRRIFRELDRRWKDAYGAGVFTEFLEQRAPGHTVLGDKIYRKGFYDIKRDIQKSLRRLDFVRDPRALDKKEELQAMAIALEGLILYARRYADRLASLARQSADPVRKAELEKMSAICRRVPAHRPRTFHEALQYYWFVHVGVITELNPWDSFNPGRLDQHLYPFYREEEQGGTLTREAAIELLQAFWIKFHNHPAPPKVGVTAEESSTYTDFALINIGGLKKDGTDGVNDLSYLLLEVIEEMRMVQPSSMVQISRKNPDRLLKRAARVIKSGFGQPSIFNADAIVAQHLRQGKDLEDAREGGASGCVESGVFGRESYILTGYFNLVKVMELALHRGVDPVSGRRIGPVTPDPRQFADFDDFYSAFEKQLRFFIDTKIRGNNLIERIYTRFLPAPFLSLLIDDCVERGLDYHDGGARYNNNYIQGVGIGTGTDVLASLKFNVFEQQNIALEDLLRALADNFEGHEILRRRLLNKTPKYGNDNPAADDLAVRLFDSFFAMVDGRPNTRGGHYRINLLPTTVHVYFGSVLGATPDGRKAYTPISEGISPVQGMDRKGPVAVMKSAARIDHLKTGGTLLNQKLSPSLLSDEKGLDSLVQLIRGYFRFDTHHVQFNVVDKKILLAAQKDPQSYRNLIVRVAGYSDYFCNLGRDLQDEIIRRTEHTDF